MSIEFVFGEASQVFLWAVPEVESWGAAQALHYVQPIFSLPPHLCGNHFQFVSLLALPGLSQEDPFMIDVVATATLFSRGRGQSSVIHRCCLKKLLIKDCSVFFTGILRGWRTFLKFSVCLHGCLACLSPAVWRPDVARVWERRELTWCFTVCRRFLTASAFLWNRLLHIQSAVACFSGVLCS